MKRARTAGPAPSKDEFRLEEFLPYQLSVTANRVSRLFAHQYAEGFGLTVPEWRVIAVVGRFEAISPSRVSEWTGMDKVKVSRAAATLVARGLLRQTQDPADGRARVLRMTRKGQRVFEAVVPLAQRLEDELTQGLSRTEWASFQKTLAKLHAHVERIAGSETEPEPEPD
jgi:DNA-binding MarR family transcriptional regulator